MFQEHVPPLHDLTMLNSVNWERIQERLNSTHMSSVTGLVDLWIFEAKSSLVPLRKQRKQRSGLKYSQIYIPKY